MPNIFNSVKMTRPTKNVFDLSHDVKLSLNPGFLVPTLMMEAVPGDKFNLGCDSMLRFAPLVAPMMHRVDVTMHYFFVPNRLLWENWEKFITNTLVGGTLPAFPFIDVDSGNWNSLMDYLGIPPVVAPQDEKAERVSALPFAAYQMIYNEYYRDQNLIDEVPYELIDGNNIGNISALSALRRRAWEHDYFTSSLPFAQKGAGVDIPLGEITLDPDNTTPWSVRNAADNSLGLVGTLSGEASSGAPLVADADPAQLDPMGSLINEPTTINDLRRAFRLQEWLEKAARGGSRYIENILAHFGVRSSDKRLQRPEYIVGTKSPVIISEVLNTSNTAEAPQGNMAGHGVSVTNGKYGGYYCEEHGYIVGIMSVMPKTAYMQGVPKHFLKYSDPFQYYWPSFANIGEQEVLKRELYAFMDVGDEVFGYVPRYAEYKYQNNRVSGDFRDTLDFWHWARKFATQPELNKEFVECNPDTRIFAVEDGTDVLWAHVLHRIRAVRSMPKYGTPTF